LKNTSNSEQDFQWTKFAGLASQWAVALIILLFLGKYIDKKDFFKINTPLFIWLLPFIFIILSLFDIIKKTNAKSKSKP
jgi:hypothetical protein